MKNQSLARPYLAVLSVLAMLAAPTAAQEDRANEALAAMRGAAGSELSVTRSARTGLATFVSAPRGRAIPLTDRAALTPAARALSFVAVYGDAFGLRGNQDVVVSRMERDAQGIDHVRLRQVVSGLPVTGGELVVHLRGSSVVAANGKTLDSPEGFIVIPALAANQAENIARTFSTRRLHAPNARLSPPRLEIFNRGLLTGRNFPTRLAWFVEASGEFLREFIWIDARSGTVLLNFSQLPDAKNRRIHDANSTSTIPGALIRSEGEAATGAALLQDALNAYTYSGDTYDYFFTQHGRDSFDGAGAVIRSTIRYCDDNPVACPYANAFWDGNQMVYGAGYTADDDVVAHELSHAVTEKTANLFYYMQSGALNESFSDIFGESVDQLNLDPEPVGSRWLVGEELPGGAIRNMMTPTLFNDPGKMTDSQFKCDVDPIAQDSGGVHTNSGVPNHAFALMVDGGTYNGFTIAPLDANPATSLVKAGKIQYRALTQYLVSASDFLDNYNALQQACSDLIGTSGITAGNCSEVKKALDAVQMSNTWPCAPPQAAAPALCSAGLVPVNAFLDNFEAGLGNWAISGDSGTWFRAGDTANPLGGAAYATSGVDSLWGYNQAYGVQPTLSTIGLAANLSVPANARLYFNHSYGFEDNGAGTFYDGGIVEYSLNGGGTWTSLNPLHMGGAAYGGTIFNGAGNPLGGLSGFVGDSFGYTASQYNLSSLAGQSQVRFRFRIGADDVIDDYGWFIDDFRVYQCALPTLSISDLTLTEGDVGPLNAAFTVTLSAASTETVTVLAATASVTATANVDYTITGPGTVTFAPGETSRPVNVPVQGDLLDEFDETFVVNLSSPVNALVADGQAIGTILDNDPTPTLSIGDVSVTEGNSGQVSAVFAITLSAASEKTVTVTAATANNTALSGSDYTATGPSIVTFAAGVTSQNFAVPILGDNLHEGDETFLVNLSAAGNATILDAQALGMILNDDAAAPLSLSINSSPVAEGNSENGVQAFTVSLSATSLLSVSVNYATANGTATSGSDYVSTSGTLTIPPGSTTGTIAVAILGDTTDEPDETYFVNLSGATNAVIVDPQAVATILDDDVPLMKIESFTASPAFVAIGGCSTLAWSVTGTGTVTLQGTIVGPTGSQLVCPTQTTTYGLNTASGFGNTSSITTVSVNNGTAGLAAPTVTLPGSGQIVGVTGVGFAWTGVGGAGGYDLRVLDGSTGVLFFSGSLLGAGSTSTLITLPTGSYVFAVRGCAGGFADSQCGAYGTVPFTVSPAAPTGPPTVTFPTEGADLNASTQTFSWTAVTPNPALSGLTYEVVLRDLAAGTTALQITVPSPNLSTIFTMKSSILYELKVRACQAGCGPYSVPVRFSVSLPPVPTVAPSGVGCSVSGGNSMTCNWSTVTNADAYQVQVVQAPPAGPGGGALTVAAKQVSATTVTLPVPSGDATVFIAACNGNGCGPYATTTITAAGPNPAQANIGTPMAGTVVSGPGLLFTWNRVPGDNGSNTSYRLFVQDLSRQGTALDVFTTNNFYSAFLKAEGSRYDALVVSNPGTPGQTVGPSQGFNVSGSSATSPTLVSPAHNSSLPAGNIQLGWSPVPGATLYEYYVAVLGQGNASARGVTAGLLAQVPLTGTGAGTLYSGIVRACPQGTTCATGSDTGWGPWSNTAGGPGVTNFTVTP